MIPFVKEADACNRRLYLCSLQTEGFSFLGTRVDVNFRYYTYGIQGHTVSKHRHLDYEFERVHIGRNAYTVEGHDGVLTPESGQCVVMPSGTSHAWTLLEAPIGITRYWVAIQPVDELGSHFKAALRRAVIEQGYLVPCTPQIDSLEQAIWLLLNSTRPLSVISSLVGSTLQQIVTLFFECCLKDQLNEFLDQEEVHAARASKEMLIPDIKRYILENLCKMIRVQDVCDHFHLSERHLNRLFQRKEGCSIGSYIKNKKLALAEDRLINTEKTVKEVGLSLGFANPSHFSRFFYANKSLYPLEYRKLYTDADRANSSIMKQHSQPA